MGTFEKFIESDAFFPMLCVVLIILVGVFVAVLVSGIINEKKAKEEKRSRLDETAVLRIIREDGAPVKEEVEEDLSYTTEVSIIPINENSNPNHLIEETSNVASDTLQTENNIQSFDAGVIDDNIVDNITNATEENVVLNTNTNIPEQVVESTIEETHLVAPEVVSVPEEPKELPKIDIPIMETSDTQIEIPETVIMTDEVGETVNGPEIHQVLESDMVGDSFDIVTSEETVIDNTNGDEFVITQIPVLQNEVGEEAIDLESKSEENVVSENDVSEENILIENEIEKTNEDETREIDFPSFPSVENRENSIDLNEEAKKVEHEVMEAARKFINSVMSGRE